MVTNLHASRQTHTRTHTTGHVIPSDTISKSTAADERKMSALCSERDDGGKTGRFFREGGVKDACWAEHVVRFGES